jgi:hypothetical protein
MTAQVSGVIAERKKERRVQYIKARLTKLTAFLL